MILTLKYVTVYAGLFFHKFETTYRKKVCTVLSINKALNPFAPAGRVIIPIYHRAAISQKMRE